jgi:hypothetical protein
MRHGPRHQNLTSAQAGTVLSTGGRRSWLDESRARSLIRRSGGWNELKGVVGRGAEHSAEMELTSGAGGPHVGLIACE